MASIVFGTFMIFLLLILGFIFLLLAWDAFRQFRRKWREEDKE